jgi:hypothetical protein
LELRKAHGIDGIPNECLRHLPRLPLVHLTHLFNHCLLPSHFSNSWKEAKIITLPKLDKYPKFLQNLRPIILLPTTDKLFGKVILKLLQNTLEKVACLTQASLVSVHITARHCNCNNNISTAAVFFHIDKAFVTTWHSGLPYELSKLKFSKSLMQLIGSFLSHRKFSVSVECEISTP